MWTSNRQTSEQTAGQRDVSETQQVMLDGTKPS